MGILLSEMGRNESKYRRTEKKCIPIDTLAFI